MRDLIKNEDSQEISQDLNMMSVEQLIHSSVPNVVRSMSSIMLPIGSLFSHQNSALLHKNPAVSSSPLLLQKTSEEIINRNYFSKTN